MLQPQVATTLTLLLLICGLGSTVDATAVLQRGVPTTATSIKIPKDPLKEYNVQPQSKSEKHQRIDSDSSGLDIVPIKEVTGEQLRRMLDANEGKKFHILEIPVSSEETDDQGRRFGIRKDDVVHVIINAIVSGATTASPTTEATTTTTTTTTTAAPGTRYVPVPYIQNPSQFFGTRLNDIAGNGLFPGLSYNALDMNRLGFLGGSSLSSAAAIGGAGIGGGAPLVPITLGNNAVAYIPMNLRMLRGFGNIPTPTTNTEAPYPIREDEDAADDSDSEVILDEPQLIETDEDDATDANPPPKKVPSSRFPIFRQNFRHRNGNPIFPIAKNIRRGQSQ